MSRLFAPSGGVFRFLGRAYRQRAQTPPQAMIQLAQKRIGCQRAAAVPFEVQYVVQVGDVNNDGKMLASDLSAIFPKIPTANADDQERADVNGDGKVLAGDLSAVFPHIPSVPVPKPSGH